MAGLELSAQKSVAMLFTQKKEVGQLLDNPLNPVHLSIIGVELKWQEEARYLGVYLDPKLTFLRHIQIKLKAARMTIMRLRSSIGKLWGPSPYLIRWAYLCFVCPTLTFWHFTWGSKITTKSLKLKLGKIQAEALRLCGHFRLGTPMKPRCSSAGSEVIPECRGMKGRIG